MAYGHLRRYSNQLRLKYSWLFRDVRRQVKVKWSMYEDTRILSITDTIKVLDIESVKQSDKL